MNSYNKPYRIYSCCTYISYASMFFVVSFVNNKTKQSTIFLYDVAVLFVAITPLSLLHTTHSVYVRCGTVRVCTDVNYPDFKVNEFVPTVSAARKKKIYNNTCNLYAFRFSLTLPSFALARSLSVSLCVVYIDIFISYGKRNMDGYQMGL